jgi:hypothetical protein
VTLLIDNSSKDTIEIGNCHRRDLAKPNHYWDKDSKFLIFEGCSEAFQESRIKIFNLKTKRTDFELHGLIGNYDTNQDQFDSRNNLLFYFDTSGDSGRKIPDLWMFDLKTMKGKKLCEFEATFEMEFPQVIRNDEKRTITVTYTDIHKDEQVARQISY